MMARTCVVYVTYLVALCTYINRCVTLGDVVRDDNASNIVYIFVVSEDVHLDLRWGHVSITLRGQSVQWMFE